MFQHDHLVFGMHVDCGLTKCSFWSHICTVLQYGSMLSVTMADVGHSQWRRLFKNIEGAKVGNN